MSSGKCSCGSNCSCGSGCNCNSCGVETSTTATIIVAGVAPKMTFAEGTETSFVAESGNGCKCGSSCSCDPCNLSRRQHFSHQLCSANTIFPNLSSTDSNLDSISSNSKPTILVIEKLGDTGLDLLKSFVNTDCFYNLSLDDLCSKVTMCDALIVISGTKVNHRVFEVVKGRLKVIAREGVCIDNVDLQVVTKFGCRNRKRKMIGKYILTGCTTTSIERKDNLNCDMHSRSIESFKHDLCRSSNSALQRNFSGGGGVGKGGNNDSTIALPSSSFNCGKK
ncbi:unnamed protein product [Lactuca virosa]|uniref:Metallothionein-like protein n=1 Tax=Lactuca virosa TaxID=75947 RepID=A0AAU9MM57_9ASTR|nr:unnamed protein product [Lactuca virosa]